MEKAIVESDSARDDARQAAVSQKEHPEDYPKQKPDNSGSTTLLYESFQNRLKSAKTVQQETSVENVIWLTNHKKLAKSANGAFASLR
jgi:hypothetical protein